VILGWFGLPRVGKSYLCALTAFRYQKAGYKIFSNIPFRGGYKITYEDIKEGFILPNRSVLLVDEVQKWANAREWANLDNHLYNYFSQGGKLGVELFYSAQDSSRVDKTLREVTNYFYLVTSIFLTSPEQPPPVYKTLPLFKRFIIEDVYTNNIDMSMGRKPLHRKFHIINPKYFSLYDSNYVIKGREFISSVKKDLPIWDKGALSG
jgi:hypothetical protein